MNFGQAIEALKQGKKVQRQGWNGKGMFLYYHEGKTITERENIKPPQLKDQPLPLTILPRIDMKSATGEIVVGWLASQTDMLCEDWQIVE